MRITLVAIALAATVVALVGASGPAQADAGKTASYTGCLAKGDEAGTFELTNVGEAKDEYELVGGGKDLEAHVGHKVEVKGSLISDKEAAAAGHKTEGETAHKHLRVTSMSHIAASCP
jgi:hypothetical protein